jgi:Na+-translocating ferredoxin:NAD+ oxidoreductase RnfE subunit
MENHSNKNEVLNTFLTVLNIGLEALLSLIALGCLIGLWEVLR